MPRSPCRSTSPTKPPSTASSITSRPPWRRIDILVNNAGHDIGGRTRFDLGSADDWSAIIETNLIGLMRVTRALLPPMVQRDTGDIVNMSSISALRIVPDMAAYTTSKAGVRAFTDVLRGELAETGIRVTEILPGLTRTGIIRTRYRGDTVKEKDYFDTFKMALEPDDVARCIVVRARPAAQRPDRPAGRTAGQPLVMRNRRARHLPWSNSLSASRATRNESTAAGTPH